MTADDRNWVNPVASWQGYRPVVSDNYSAVKTPTHREHHGVDVMFRRKSPADQPQYPAGTPAGSPGYFMTDTAQVLAAADGTLWSSKMTPGGISIVIDHGKPWATYYQHLAKALVPIGIASGHLGIRIARGQPIGIVGGSPLDGEHLRHLHFEMWKGGGADAHVDPQREGFDSWPVFDQRDTSTTWDSRRGMAQSMLEEISKQGVQKGVKGRGGVSLPVVLGVGAAGLLVAGILIASAVRDDLV